MKTLTQSRWPMFGWTQVQQWRREMRLRQVIFSAQTQREIVQAGQQFGISPALIASILADERTRLDAADHFQNALMRLSMLLPDWAEQLLIQSIERACGRSVDTFSLGRAQMKGGTLARLSAEGHLPVLTSASQSRHFLLSDGQAPFLVAACLRSTVDYWQRGGVDLLENPAVLGTLYSLGITGKRGVHADPQPSVRGRAIAAHAKWLARPSQGVFGNFSGQLSAV
ncbi:hypothetical protein FNU79_17845 [Deinococcus detaillensis]|uniref:Uncharacterized protein n=1 Tax=Deinococcus detaillensis TaxID=2592048 RepID=A0A553UH10_9DEIO|nr:hypothetical protein [Deinococcus detaillensis]TSA79509.1 hypothetical protein FNU79_17845 [Deinococcus detaillensis]